MLFYMHFSGCFELFMQVYDSANGDLLLTLTKTRHLIVTFNQLVEVGLIFLSLFAIAVIVYWQLALSTCGVRYTLCPPNVHLLYLE